MNPRTDSGIPKPKRGSLIPHTKTGIPEPKWGCNSNESPNRFGDPQTDSGIPEFTYQNGDPRIGLGIVQSLTRSGLGFVPIWGLTELVPKLNGIQNGDPLLVRGSPNRFG